MGSMLAAHPHIGSEIRDSHFRRLPNYFKNNGNNGMNTSEGYMTYT